MANLMIPEGYEKLAAIGIAYKGVYEASKAYGILNAVYHNGSTFVSLKDGPEGEPTGDGVNWQYMAKGFVEGLLSTVQAKDTSGIIGTAGEMVNAQSLLDVIADRVANKLINKNKIVNNLTSTDASAVLAAPQGKTLKDEIGEVNRKLGEAFIVIEGSATITARNFGYSIVSVGSLGITAPSDYILFLPKFSVGGAGYHSAIAIPRGNDIGIKSTSGDIEILVQCKAYFIHKNYITL